MVWGWFFFLSQVCGWESGKRRLLSVKECNMYNNMDMSSASFYLETVRLRRPSSVKRDLLVSKETILLLASAVMVRVVAVLKMKKDYGAHEPESWPVGRAVGGETSLFSGFVCDAGMEDREWRWFWSSGSNKRVDLNPFLWIS